MRKFFWYLIIVCCGLFCFSCTKSEPNREEGEFVEHKWLHPIETNKDKVESELIHKSYDFKIFKVTINDTIVSYFLYEHGTGYLKIN